jgi:hypothetical protein
MAVEAGVGNRLAAARWAHGATPGTLLAVLLAEQAVGVGFVPGGHTHTHTHTHRQTDRQSGEQDPPPSSQAQAVAHGLWRADAAAGASRALSEVLQRCYVALVAVDLAWLPSDAEAPLLALASRNGIHLYSWVRRVVCRCLWRQSQSVCVCVCMCVCVPGAA